MNINARGKPSSRLGHQNGLSWLSEGPETRTCDVTASLFIRSKEWKYVHPKQKKLSHTVKGEFW